MIRKMLTATLVVAAMLLSVLSLGGVTESVEAQGAPTCPYYNAVVAGTSKCADALAYPSGGFSVMPTTPGGKYGFGSTNPQAAAATAATTPATAGTGGGLAVTGSESAVLGYVGAGLVAFGAVALGSRRKFFQGALED